jgi:ATP-dependent helicase/nuclease subunit A
LIAAGLAAVLQPAPSPWDASETILRFGAAAAAGADIAGTPAPQTVDDPAWLRRPAPAEATTAPLSPSRAAALPPSSEAGQARRQAGALIHALLQRLPELAPERRRAAAERFLATQGAMLDAATRAELVERALATLGRPELAPLFAPGSRAEVAIGGALARAGRAALPISGRIDRLAVAPNAIYLADYKNSARPAANPPAYVTQLALYRAALSSLYPDRPIRAHLIWLAGGETVEIGDAELEAALAAVLAAS